MATEINFERAVLSIDSAAIIVSRSKPALFEPRGETRALDEGQVSARAILLTLRYNELYIR